MPQGGSALAQSLGDMMGGWGGGASLGVLNEATGAGSCRTVTGTQHGSINVCLIKMEGLL